MNLSDVPTPRLSTVLLAVASFVLQVQTVVNHSVMAEVGGADMSTAVLEFVFYSTALPAVICTFLVVNRMGAWVLHGPATSVEVAD